MVTQSFFFKPKEKVEEESQSKMDQMQLLLLFAKKRNLKNKNKNGNEVFLKGFKSSEVIIYFYWFINKSPDPYIWFPVCVAKYT